jgi:hypothetical protein
MPPDPPTLCIGWRVLPARDNYGRRTWGWTAGLPFMMGRIPLSPKEKIDGDSN